MKHITEFFGRALGIVSPQIEIDTLRPQAATYSDALAFIKEAHAHQVDSATGTLYYTHPVRVSGIYMELKPDYTSDEVIAALLHDTLEDGLIKDDQGAEKRRVTAHDLHDMGYSEKSINMVEAVSKPPKFTEDKRTPDQKLEDNIAFVEDLVETGTFEDKLLKFCDALANRGRQTLEMSGQHDANKMAYRVQKTDDTLHILYADLKDYLAEQGYEDLHSVVHKIVSADTHSADIPGFPDEPPVAEPDL